MTEATFEERTIKDWDDFTKLINKFDVSVPPLLTHLYRGQSDESWDLEPSFHRHFKSMPLPKIETLLHIERTALIEFSSQSHLYESEKVISSDGNILEWWMLMQHHHAPTRLLDWTSSPYVAAYHACAKDFEKNGAIWALHAGFLHKQMKKIYKNDNIPPQHQPDSFFLEPNSTSEVYFAMPKLKTDRMVAQQGFFTICRNIGGNQHKIILNACAEAKDYQFLVKFIIPPDKKVEFLKKQRIMNITASSLFPGLDGLGRSVKELVHFNAFRKEKEFLKSLVPKSTPTLGDIFKTDDAGRDQKDT